MPKFLAVDRKHRPIAVLLAESTMDADLYGLRKLHNYLTVERVPDDHDTSVDASLRESFRALGLSEASASTAAQGRGNGAGLPLLTVPYQEASPAFRAEAATSAGLARVRAGVEAARARGAGTPPAQPTTEIRETTLSSSFPVELTEVFENLGLSPESARRAAEGRA